MSAIAMKLSEVQARVARACARAGRPPSLVQLVAVSKLQPAEAVREAYAAGQRDFGENYAQELRDKAAELAPLPDDEAVNRLCELRGVGRWTAEYVLLRGLGRTHIFPGDDVGARKNLQRWLRLANSLDYQGVRRVLSRWGGYAGLVYFHLLLDRLEQRYAKP